MISDKKLANAVAGRTARACDGCIRKRARWYCAADDAFLCQSCDSSVHSANPLARRHERVRLKMALFKTSEDEEENFVPTWHHGFTKKARTPRHGKHQSKRKSYESTQYSFHPVPEINSDEASQEDNEEQLLYRVPIFDPFVAEMCSASYTNEAAAASFNDAEAADTARNETKSFLLHEVNSFHGFLPSEMDLSDFAADVQTLLGKGLETESFDMERLGLLDCKEEAFEGSLCSGRVKVEEEAEHVEAAAIADRVDAETGFMRESFELSFGYDSLMTCEYDEKHGPVETIEKKDGECKTDEKRKKILLKLDYDGVCTAWSDQRSPWTTGKRPEVNLNDWPYFTCSSWGVHLPYDQEMGTTGGQTAVVDGGRQARVSRYREKRRTRLFSKKIRYEVRKLNAEKRPRIKGRFVKRANFATPGFPLLAVAGK